MLFFPNCKINLGLYVTEKRKDGYHNIETVFYPIGWCDALEILENKTPGANPLNWHNYPSNPDIPVQENLVYKAWNLVSQSYPLPPLHIHFMKKIPSGAGLGGGSSDAARTIELLNQKFQLGIPEGKRMEMAAQLGSDCPYFIKNKPQYATGRGDVLSDCKIDLSSYFILLVNPGLHSHTGRAYEKISPRAGRASLKDRVENFTPEMWKGQLENDFEAVVGAEFPEIPQLIAKLYHTGALYAAMSGSGSTVYGIFRNKPEMSIFSEYTTFLQEATPAVS